MPVGVSNPGRRGPFRTRRGRRRVGRRPVRRNVKSYVRRAINRQFRTRVESKYHLQVYDQQINGFGVVSRLSAMAQGTSDVLRVGDRIRLGTLRLNLTWQRDSGDTTDNQRRCRIIVFQWCNNDALHTPTVADIITATTYPTLRMLDNDNLKAGMIRPVYDRVFVLDADDPAVDQSVVLMPRKRYVDFYQSGVNGQNHWYFCAISDAALNAPRLQMMSKVNFTDA